VDVVGELVVRGDELGVAEEALLIVGAGPDGEDGGEDEGEASRSSSRGPRTHFLTKIFLLFSVIIIFKYFPECLPWKSNRPKLN